MLRRTGLIFVILIALIATAAFVYGQDAGRTPAAQESRAGSHQEGPDARSVDRIAWILAENQQALGLTDAQVERLARALAEAQARSYAHDGHRDYRDSGRRHWHGPNWCYRDHSDHGSHHGWCCH